MAITLELFDGSTTINFVGSTNYKASIDSLSFGPPKLKTTIAGITLRGVEYGPRELSFSLRVVGSSASDLKSKVRDLENILSVAEQRQVNGEGTVVLLKVQVGNTDADDISFRVLTGSLDLTTAVLDTLMVDSNFTEIGRLTLLTEPFGRLAAVTESTATLENEQDDPTFNYMDITSIAGTHGSKLQLKIDESGTSWTGTKKMWVAKRSGERRTDTLFFQGEDEASLTAGTNPGGAFTAFASDGAEADATQSGGQVARFGWEQSVQSQGLAVSWTSIGYAQYDITGGNIPNGLYRVLVMCKEDTTAGDGGGPDVVFGDMGMALGWVYGGLSKVPVDGDDVKFSADNTYEVMDLGELALPPANVPDGFTPATFNLRIYGTYKDTTAASNQINNGEYLRWLIDYIFLLPIDEGSAIINSVSADTDLVLLDSLSDTPGVYILDTSSVVQKFADVTGGPFDIGPEDTRIFVLRNDTGNPTTVAFTVDAVHTPLVMDI